MPSFLFAILLLAIVFGELNMITNRVRKNAYQWWYTPWFSMVYALVVYLIYRLFNLPGTVLLVWLAEEYRMETFYCLVALILWVPLQSLFRKPSLHESLIGPFRKVFAKDEKEAAHLFPFPYYYSEGKAKVMSRVGRVFYRLTFKSVIIVVAVVYAIALIVAHYYSGFFFPLSAFGILGLLPLMEYYFYLSAEVDNEEEVITEGGESRAPSDFDLLWKLFVDRFDNYNVAWKRELDADGKERRNGILESNNSKFNKLFKDFKDSHKGGIIEDSDLLTAFTKLVPFFMDVIKEGHYILVLFDIPKHFSDSGQDSYLNEIAARLTSVLVKRFPKINEVTKFIVYGKESTNDVFDNSIVMTSLSDLSRKIVEDREWMRNLGLVVAVNVFDKGVSNLYETRKFSYQLRTVNEGYQIIIISPFRKELEPSLENTWVTNREKVLPECQIKPSYHSDKHYYVGYNFEEFEERLDKVLKSNPNKVYYSGSEMLVFPLSSRYGGMTKAVTPVHQLELAYTDTLEGNEEIRNSGVFKDEFSVSFDSYTDVVHPHILPIDEVVETQAFSIIYDHENNASASYLRWVHLGNKESFTIVISKPYLFRDYFCANHDYFATSPFAALQPRLCKSRITLAIILLSLLKEGKQDEDAIKAQLFKYYDEGEVVSVPEKLRELFSTYFNENLANDLRTSEEVSFDGNSYQTHVKFWIAHPDLVNLPYLETVQFKDNNGNVIFEILKDLLYQNFCQNQHHSFLGLPYTINDFDPANNTQNVSRSREISNVLFYKPCYRISANLTNAPLPIKDLSMTEPITYFHHTGMELAYQMQAFETEICIDTKAWISFEKKYESPVFAGGASKLIPCNPAVTPKRKYSRGKILKFSLRYLPLYSDRIDSVRKMMQILLYEGLQSLFPHHAQYLIVASQGEGDREGNQDILPWIFNEFYCDDPCSPGWLTFYFIEDAHIDLGLLGVLTYEAICYLFEYIFDYLMWLTEEPFIPEGYIEYLHRKNPDKMSFLRYGRKELPDYFDIDLAINFIRDHFSFKKELTVLQQKRNSHNGGMGVCDFCRAKLKNSDMTRLDDGRMRCVECGKGAIDTEAQFRELCDKVKEAFRTHLGIDFSSIPHTAHLVSAVTLHKLNGVPFSITNGYDIRKLIGLACNGQDDKFYVENGYQEEKTFGIIAHELTHIWEYNNEDFRKVRKTNEDLVEGLAVWTDLFLSAKNGATDTEQMRTAWMACDNEYGRGLRFIMENCPDDPYGYIHQKANP